MGLQVAGDGATDAGGGQLRQGGGGLRTQRVGQGGNGSGLGDVAVRQGQGTIGSFCHGTRVVICV